MIKFLGNKFNIISYCPKKGKFNLIIFGVLTRVISKVLCFPFP